MSTNSGMDKSIMVQSQKGIVHGNENKRNTAHTTIWRNLTNNIKNPDNKKEVHNIGFPVCNQRCYKPKEWLPQDNNSDLEGTQRNSRKVLFHNVSAGYWCVTFVEYPIVYSLKMHFFLFANYVSI